MWESSLAINPSKEKCHTYYITLKLLEAPPGQDASDFLSWEVLERVTQVKVNRRVADIMVSNIDITYCKWKDNYLVRLATNFRLTEETTMQDGG